MMASLSGPAEGPGVEVYQRRDGPAAPLLSAPLTQLDLGHRVSEIIPAGGTDMAGTVLSTQTKKDAD